MSRQDMPGFRTLLHEKLSVQNTASTLARLSAFTSLEAFLWYVRDCSRNISVRVLYQAVKIKLKIMCHVTTQKENTGLNILHHMCPTAPQAKTTIVTLFCVPDKKKFMSASNTKERC